MSDSLRLSVVIPTYHRERQVLEAVGSIIDEGIDDLEVLVVDDSPEGSAREAVESIEDPRVRYLTMAEPSGGRPAMVRNFAIEQARGDCLYFLDDDDTIAKGGLIAMLSALEAAPRAGVAFGTVIGVGPDLDIVRGHTLYWSWAARVARLLRRSSWLTVGAIMFRGTLIINSCCMIRRETARQLGGYDVSIPVYEDVEFFTRGIRQAGHVFVDVPVLRYSTGQQSIIHDLKGDHSLVQASYKIMHSKYRNRSPIGYRALQVVSKLLPIGSPHSDTAVPERTGG